MSDTLPQPPTRIADGSVTLDYRAPAAPAREWPSVPGYEILGELGRGGMGVVYLALHEADGEIVALKAITPALVAARADVEHFLRAASVLRELDHPRIVRLGEMGESQGLLYVAMEYVRGRDAGRLLEEHGPLPIDRAVSVVCQLLEALEYAHVRHVVHRDVKPSNLLIAADDSVKLADFGLARVYQASKLSGLTMTGDGGGSVGFLAPEQVTQYRDARPPGDLYAAAATLYNLLTGQMPHDAPDHSQLMLLKILEHEPVPLRQRRPDIPAELAAIIHRALARDPDQRFADANAMREALRPFAE